MTTCHMQRYSLSMDPQLYLISPGKLDTPEEQKGDDFFSTYNTNEK